MWQETPPCHGDHPRSHLSRGDSPACCSKEASPAQDVPGGACGHRSALLPASALGPPLGSVKHRHCQLRQTHCQAAGPRHGGAPLSQPWCLSLQCHLVSELPITQGWLPLASWHPHPVPQFTLLLHGDDHTCLPCGLIDVSSRLQMRDVIKVSPNNLYVTSWKYSFMCSHQEKWHSGSEEGSGISATLLRSFPSPCTDAAEGKAQQEEFNSELKCRRQEKEAEVAEQLICKSQTYSGWWIMSCQDYRWQQNGWI